MKYVVAVSGGVDSVVLLSMMAARNSKNIVVAHFDHGIREESDADARFVEALARQYDVPFETERQELGKTASENAAREARYSFLTRVAEKHGGVLLTAHHKDDVAETIAINLTRGTGWRGLAVLNRENSERPLLNYTKQELYEYALAHSLEWVEDETNFSDEYLRNALRHSLTLSRGTKNRLLELRNAQVGLALKIDEESNRVLEHNEQSRYFFTMIDEESALELLRACLVRHGTSLTRPQRRKLLHAIKTFYPGSRFEAGQGVAVDFGRTNFIVNPKG